MGRSSRGSGLREGCFQMGETIRVLVHTRITRKEEGNRQGGKGGWEVLPRPLSEAEERGLGHAWGVCSQATCRNKQEVDHVCVRAGSYKAIVTAPNLPMSNSRLGEKSRWLTSTPLELGVEAWPT